MRITFCCADTQADPWLMDLRAALPGVDISLWQPGAPPADYAIVWAPPQAFLMSNRSSRRPSISAPVWTRCCASTSRRRPG